MRGDFPQGVALSAFDVKLAQFVGTRKSHPVDWISLMPLVNL